MAADIFCAQVARILPSTNLIVFSRVIGYVMSNTQYAVSIKTTAEKMSGHQDTRTVLGCQQERPHDLPGLEPDHSLQCRPQRRDKRYCQAQNDGSAQTTIIYDHTKTANESS
jgi:hypothetical protein